MTIKRKENKVTIWTNYVDDSIKQVAIEEMKKGNLVRIEADCIGHTRTQMIENDAARFFKDQKAMAVRVTWTDLQGFDWIDTYYTLKGVRI